MIFGSQLIENVVHQLTKEFPKTAEKSVLFFTHRASPSQIISNVWEVLGKENLVF
jgi:hypothetical protein